MKKTLKSLLAGVLAVLLLVAVVPMDIEVSAQENEYVIHDDETITIDIEAGNFTAVKVVPECGGVYDVVIYSDNIVCYQFDSEAEKWHEYTESEYAEDYSSVYMRRFLTPDNTYYFGARYSDRERSGSVEIKLALVACECPHSVKYITTTDSMGATCTKDGHTEGAFCDLCGACIRGYKTIPASHKDYNNDKICDVCKEENITVYYCPTTHDFESYFTVDVEPDCTNTGLKSRHCALCAEVTDVTVIPADGHNWSAFSEAYKKEATCTKDGKAYRHCGKCDAVESKITEKLGHDFSFSSEVPPTCESVGFLSQYCERCRDTITTEIPATGHTWGEWKVTTAATVKAEGKEERACTACEAKETRSIARIPAISETITVNEKIKTSSVAKDSVFALAGLTAAALKATVSCDVQILDKNSKAVADKAKLATGMQIVLTDEKGNVLDTVTVVVPGDVDGDGFVKSSDARQALRAAVNLETLVSCEKSAADLDNTSKKQNINSADARYILRAAVGLENTKDWLDTLN